MSHSRFNYSEEWSKSACGLCDLHDSDNEKTPKMILNITRFQFHQCHEMRGEKGSFEATGVLMRNVEVGGWDAVKGGRCNQTFAFLNLSPLHV